MRYDALLRDEIFGWHEQATYGVRRFLLRCVHRLLVTCVHKLFFKEMLKTIARESLGELRDEEQR